MEDDNTNFGWLIFKILAEFHLEMPESPLEMLILTSLVVLRRKVA